MYTNLNLILMLIMEAQRHQSLLRWIIESPASTSLRWGSESVIVLPEFSLVLLLELRTLPHLRGAH